MVIELYRAADGRPYFVMLVTDRYPLPRVESASRRLSEFTQLWELIRDNETTVRANDPQLREEFERLKKQGEQHNWKFEGKSKGGRHLRLSYADLDSPQFRGLSLSAKTVLTLSLWRHENRRTHTCWPSYITIMAETGISSDRTVTKALRELDKAGVVTKKRVSYETPDGQVRSRTVYQLHHKRER